MSTLVNRAFVAAERAGELLVPFLGTVVAGENEESIFRELFPGAPWVVGGGEVVAQATDEDVVFVNEILADAVARRSILVSTRSDDLLVAKFFIRGVGPVIYVGGEVEKEGFFFCVGGAEELATLSVEDFSDFVENVGAVELFAIFGGPDDFTTMDPAGAPGLIGCVGSTLFED